MNCAVDSLLCRLLIGMEIQKYIRYHIYQDFVNQSWTFFDLLPYLWVSKSTFVSQEIQIRVAIRLWEFDSIILPSFSEYLIEWCYPTCGTREWNYFVFVHLNLTNNTGYHFIELRVLLDIKFNLYLNKYIYELKNYSFIILTVVISFFSFSF